MTPKAGLEGLGAPGSAGGAGVQDQGAEREGGAAAAAGEEGPLPSV